MNQNLLLILIVVIVVFYLLKKNEHFATTPPPDITQLSSIVNNLKNDIIKMGLTPPPSVNKLVTIGQYQFYINQLRDYIKKNTPTVQYNNSLTTTNFNLEPTMTSTPMTTSVPIITVPPQCPANYTDSNGNLVTYSYNAITGMCHGYYDRKCNKCDKCNNLNSVTSTCISCAGFKDKNKNIFSAATRYCDITYPTANPGFSCDPNLPNMCSTDITPIPK